VSAPFSAPTVPPDNGASRYRAPVAVTRSCDRSTSGSIVDVSTTILPSVSAGIAASSTWTTSGELGTHRIVTSLARTTPAGSSPSVAPAATTMSIGTRLRDVTVTS
jgi:hypothetical protein